MSMRPTSAVLVGQRRESPDVSDAHREADTGEDKLPLGAPLASLRLLLAIQRVCPTAGLRLQ